MRPYRTLLEQKIRERRMTLEEFAAYAETFAREHCEPGTLSLRHLQRLVTGKGPKGQPLGPIRPATARLLERIFETDSNELLSSPMQAVAPPDNADELRDRIQKSRRVDAGILQGLRNQLNTIRRIDRQYGAIVTHNDLLARIAQTRELLTYSLTGHTRRELAILLSEMHTLAGWQSLDTGRCSASWNHYEQAKAAGIETGEPPYYAHATAEQAFTLIDLGETKSAVDLLAATRKDYERYCSPLLNSWLAAAHGEALASDGQYSKCATLFDKAELYLPSDKANNDGPYVALNSTHLARWRGHSTSHSAHWESLSLLTQALTGLDPTFSRAECSLRIDLAMSLSLTHNVGSAKQNLYAAKLIAENIGSERQRRRSYILEKSISMLHS